MSAQQQSQPTLYERLGGVYSIATVIDDLIDRVMTDARLNANPAVNEAHHKVPPAGFKSALACAIWTKARLRRSRHLFGGSRRYSLRSRRGPQPRDLCASGLP